MNDDEPTPSVPGLGGLGPGVARFDEIVDEWLESIRGNPAVDRVVRLKPAENRALF